MVATWLVARACAEHRPAGERRQAGGAAEKRTIAGTACRFDAYRILRPMSRNVLYVRGALVRSVRVVRRLLCAPSKLPRRDAELGPEAPGKMRVVIKPRLVRNLAQRQVGRAHL